jgi:hypothetical protein
MKDQLTPLKETDIYIVEVLKDAIDFQIENNKLEYWNDYEGNNPDKDNWVGIQLPEGNWQILGTITSDSISFDPALYLEKEIVDIFYEGFEMYRDYMDDPGTFIIDPEESFRSLLTSCGYYWVNPMGEKPSDDWDWNDGDSLHNNIEANIQWTGYQKKLVTGILLALIKK